MQLHQTLGLLRNIVRLSFVNRGFIRNKDLHKYIKFNNKVQVNTRKQQCNFKTDSEMLLNVVRLNFNLTNII